MKYRINVKTIKGNILTFKGVETYEVVKGFLVFTDKLTGKIKRFHGTHCELEEEE
jgi:hypothetical protein